MANWISLRAYARHRGCTLHAVQKAIESGRVTAIVRSDDDRVVGIDQTLADQQWALNTDPAEAAKNGKFTAASVVLRSAQEETTFDSSDLNAPSGEEPQEKADGPSTAVRTVRAADEQNDYLAHRAKREEFQAKEAELSYLERIGELVSAAEVRAEQFSIFRQHRDKLDQIPAYLSERLAAETDPQRIEYLLRTAIRATLNELSTAFAIHDETPGGTAERAPLIA